MQIFKYDFLPSGRAILIKQIVDGLLDNCFITIGKFSSWEDETVPPPVTTETATEEVILYKRPLRIMLATKTFCDGITCDSEELEGDKYYLIDPTDANIATSNASHIYIEGKFEITDYICAYFRTTTVVIGAVPPTGSPSVMFKASEMLELGHPYLSINHTRIERLTNQTNLVKQLIRI